MLLYLFVACMCMFGVAYEYIVDYEKLELAYYEKSLVRDAYFLFRKYNRTNHCLNVSFVLLKDLDGRKLQFTTSVHQFLSNEYKKTGMEATYNVCEYWSRDIYGTTSFIKKFGNLEGCDIKKGFYYLYNFMPDESQFPKFVPLGRYMIQMNVVRKSGAPLLRFQWFVTARFKLNNRVYGV
ncbi:uncharacterized protein LOC107397715 [Tribolium castaneum]|uniref:Uncharacterized protein n=1 Tax=Tribolium castaneum TaxID=7070 RepID=D1ZZM4_TRICA|nr:PREDICTED: uncharacterized protein LOC107397715 [Tribolium castaneum]EFA02391.1 hypothetical protein TcasGA2_TC008071 [Tribolium castaneum]|eukprot:XP_015834325.1 PREDICTED: uncharacterized protein LOC107397715 [Tribolium castaneum]